MASRAQRRALAKLYERIPTFSCKPGCSDCCGPVPVAAIEAERAPKLLQIIERLDLTGCLDCPYSTPAGCQVYADRPFMCRLFGTTVDDPLLRCPHGAAPQEPLSAAAAAALTGEYIEITQGWGIAS